MVVRLLCTFILNNALIFDFNNNEILKLPDHPFITLQFDYIGVIIISSILIVNQKCNKKKEINKDSPKEILIYNEQDK